jgi:hypothetical protein
MTRAVSAQFAGGARRWHDRYAMTTRRAPRPQAASPRVDRATFKPGDYGRFVRNDGTEQWYVRSPTGTWTALSHQRVVENDDGTITLLYLN